MWYIAALGLLVAIPFSLIFANYENVRPNNLLYYVDYEGDYIQL